MKTILTPRVQGAALAALILTASASMAFADNVVSPTKLGRMTRTATGITTTSITPTSCTENHHGYWRENPDGTRIFINIE